MQNLQTKVTLFTFVVLPKAGGIVCIWHLYLFIFVIVTNNCVCWLQIEEKQNQLSAARKQLKVAKSDHKASHDDKSKK